MPYLQKSSHPHILNISPPLNLSPHWFGQHVAYTMAKYGMSMCVLGMASEFKQFGIGVNALWPRTAIQTAAMEMLAGASSNSVSRKPEIMADAAYEILCKDPKVTTGNFFIDENIITSAGITDLKQYACVPENADSLMPDFFLDIAPDKIASYMKDDKSKNDSSSSSGGQIDGLFAKIESSLSEELVKKVNAMYQFNVKGDEAGIWFLDLKNGAGKCGKGDPPSQPDSTLSMDSKNFFEMFTGKFVLYLL